MHHKKMHYLTFDHEPRDQGHIKCCLVPSTLCDLSRYIFEVLTSNV